MEIIFWIAFGLFIIAAIAVFVLVRKESKLYANKDIPNGHLEPDDISTRYMDLLNSEQPFVEYY